MNMNIFEAMGELGAAISQELPSDDRIIMEHVHKAHALITAEWKRQQQEENEAPRRRDADPAREGGPDVRNR